MLVGLNRQVGSFDGWEQSLMVIFGRVTPSIYVHDMERSLEFYRDILGFSVAFTNGSPVSFAVLRQDAAHLHLCVRPEEAGSCHTHILLSDLDSF
jgi:catechol 2,3-dioxygenase-like lactoylglutathione lyase family enzyme